MLAAVIGVGGTVTVAVAGFWTAARNAGKTIAEAHDSRVWDQCAVIYVEVLRWMNHQRQKRDLETRVTPWDEAEKRREEELLSQYQSPAWPELESRLQAFASEAVFRAVQESAREHDYTMLRFRVWQHADEAVRTIGGEQMRQARRTDFESLWRAQQRANAADDAAVRLIRAELRGRRPAHRGWESVMGPPDPELGGSAP